MAEGDTLWNAILGGVVTILTTAFVPFAPVAGGAIAGYLQGPDREEGLKVGALSGVVAVLPLLAVIAIVGNVFLVAVGSGGGPSLSVGGLGLVIFLFVFFALLAYVVVLSAIGGLLGSYLNEEDVL